jgi:hypothetical protein
MPFIPELLPAIFDVPVSTYIPSMAMLFDADCVLVATTYKPCVQFAELSPIVNVIPGLAVPDILVPQVSPAGGAIHDITPASVEDRTYPVTAGIAVGSVYVALAEFVPAVKVL